MRGATLFLALSALSLVVGCGGAETETQAEVGATIVKVASVERTRFDGEVSLVGSIEAWQVATLVPDVPGRIRSVEVRIGQKVDKSEVLLSLVDDDYAQGVLQAEAATDMAKAQLSGAEATHRRFTDLKARDAVTDAEFEKVDVALRLAQAQVRQAEVGLSVAKDRLYDTRLRAPFAGTVIARNVEVGEMLGGGPGKGPPIQLADLSRVRVTASIGETQASKISIGDVISVQVDALPGEAFAGKVERINGQVDVRTRSVKVEAVLDEPDPRLIHGMSAGFLIEGVADEHLAIPREALLNRDDGTARVLVTADGSVTSREVRYGRSRTGLVPILEGLEAGEQVLVAGHTRLADGSPITIAGTPQ
ncbi:MAG: efflux RND transporter periplasmic adaptor subunit [Deltaproteobacteria bacterium]|nr:MAG: efflux RND transporter periplasmic adaptor subunit [Deltaproteobacteria bacterium]